MPLTIAELSEADRVRLIVVELVEHREHLLRALVHRLHGVDLGEALEELGLGDGIVLVDVQRLEVILATTECQTSASGWHQKSDASK